MDERINANIGDRLECVNPKADLYGCILEVVNFNYLVEDKYQVRCEFPYQRGCEYFDMPGFSAKCFKLVK